MIDDLSRALDVEVELLLADRRPMGGSGFTSWTAITGKIVAAELCGRAHGFDLAPFDPSRFAGGGTAWSNPFTAGERANAADLGAATAPA